MLTTNQKALRTNLDEKFYGSFAEIGAGQEVVSHYFKAGAAKGTIAKSISAYDMTFSDQIYGKSKSGRYVCEERLMQMLDHEYGLLEKRLKATRGDKSNFFVFADTVSTINYNKDNWPHGWMGIRFQVNPLTPPNDLIIHVHLLDNTAHLQQEAIGILGVNLIYAACHSDNPEETLIPSLINNLSNDRVEIDIVRLSGPDVPHANNRLFSLQLVTHKLTPCILISKDKRVVQANDGLYKKHVMVKRIHFEKDAPNVNFKSLSKKIAYIEKHEESSSKDNIVLLEATLQHLKDDTLESQKDFLNKIEGICEQGHDLLISDFKEYDFLANYIGNASKRSMFLILKPSKLEKLFHPEYYNDIHSSPMLMLGTLLSNGNRIYLDVYDDFNVNALNIPDNCKSLLAYLIEADKIRVIR